MPNPFFGLPPGQGFNVTSATIQRRELLRPFPQFNDILMRQATLGKSQYHAAIFKFEKRISNGWGGRINYTYSRLKDNQFGEGNFFSRNATRDAGRLQPRCGVQHRPARRAAQDRRSRRSSSCRSVKARSGRQSGVGAAILGDWTVSSIIAIESGFPMALYANSNNTSNIFDGRMQRVNLGTGARKPTAARYERITPPAGSACATGDCGTGSG